MFQPSPRLIKEMERLTPEEQIIFWRGLGEELLRVGNPFAVMIGGMPLLEQAVRKMGVQMLKQEEWEEK